MPRAGAGVDLSRNDVCQAGRGSIDCQTGNHVGRGVGVFGFDDRLHSQFPRATHNRDRVLENAWIADDKRPRQNVQPGVGPPFGDHLGTDARDVAHRQTN